MPNDATEGTAGLSVEEGIRTLLLLLPRVVSRVKRLPVPEDLESLTLAPRHLSLLAYLLFDGEMGVNELAGRLELAPATASLMVGELSRQGVVDRREDDADRRRTIVSIAPAYRAGVDGWLNKSAGAWRKALEPLSPAQRVMFIDTLREFERELSAEHAG
jgi:DNA-binding MarR family transcriptional regulator